MLDIFRDELTQHFPFVVVPPAANAGEMKRKKPFLFLAIMMMACRHDVPRQGEVAKAIREIISQRILMKNEHTLDMLQGMLLYLAWYANPSSDLRDQTNYQGTIFICI